MMVVLRRMAKKISGTKQNNLKNHITSQPHPPPIINQERTSPRNHQVQPRAIFDKFERKRQFSLIPLKITLFEMHIRLDSLDSR
jgi:hypothetical protein